MGTKTTQVKNDMSLEPRGIVSGTAMAAGAIVAAGGVGGGILHLNPVWAVAVTVVGGGAHLMVSAHHSKHAPSSVLYRFFCWASGGSWLTWALINPHHWYNLNSLAAAGVLAIGAGIMAPFGNKTRPEIFGPSGFPGTAVVVAGGGSVGRDWQDRIKRVCKLTVTVTDVTAWPTMTGYDVHVQLPIGGATVDDLKRNTKALATDARLPRGCVIDVDEGDLQGEVVIAVPTVNRLRDEIPYAPDRRPRSIYDMVELGEFQDGDIVGVPLREMCALIIGTTGSGKTTLLDLFTDGIGHCEDALVWHIDLNGGGMTWAWMQPWIHGETSRPPVDWAAATAEEALLMVKVAHAIGLDRKGSYNHLKMQQNVRLMPLSRDLPEIVIIVDEGKTVLASTATGIIGQIRDMLIKISDELRDAGIRLVVTGLRGTSEYIHNAFKAQARVKIGMPVDSDAELAYLMDWQGLKCRDLPTKGCGYVQYDQQSPRMFKTRHILPGHIVESAIHVANTRPDLDSAGQRIGGKVYATRYERMREFYSQSRQDDASQPAPSFVTYDTPEPTRPHLSVMNGGAGAWPDPDDFANMAASSPASWPNPDDFAGGRQATRVLTGAPTLEAIQAVPELLMRALAAYDAAGDDRMHSEVLAQALGISSKQDLAALLRPLGVTSLPHQFIRNGENRRGYAREHIEDAARRIARGELEVPAEVAEWPAA